MVRALIALLYTRQANILSGATIIMVATFASKFLGLIRDRLLVHNFDTATTSIFFAAFRLPDLLFNLLIFGALSIAFIPIFTDYLHRKGEEEAFRFTSNILNLSLLTFGLAAFLVFIFTPQLNNIFVPGFQGAQKEMTDQLTRLLLFSQLILTVGSLFIGIGQSYQRFVIPSLAPVFYNTGIILGIAILSPYFGIMGPAIGVIFGAMLHVLIQLPLIKSIGFKYYFSFDFLNSGVKEVFRMMSIRNIGLIAEQLNETVSVALASLISYSSITLLTFAQHLYIVPIGLFPVAIAQAALPFLSKDWARGEKESFKFTLLTTMHQVLFLVLPAAAILIVLRIPVVRLVFGASQFSWDDTVLTGRTVAYLSLGLAAQALYLLLVRGFYALKDTRTPVIVSVTSVLVNIVLSYIFIRQFKWDVWSLGLSSAVSANLSMVMLLYFLHKKVGGFNLRDLYNPALKMLLAAVIAAAALYIPMKSLDQLVFDTTRTVNLIILTGIASFFGLGIYLYLVWFMKIKELYTFANLVQRVAKKSLNFKPQEIPEDTGGV